jgi:hypothetical protein
MKFINNWSKMYKSLSVILPIIVAVLYALINSVVDANLMPVEFLPVAMIISGYLGRIIKQDSLQ